MSLQWHLKQTDLPQWIAVSLSATSWLQGELCRIVLVVEYKLLSVAPCPVGFPRFVAVVRFEVAVVHFVVVHVVVVRHSEVGQWPSRPSSRFHWQAEELLDLEGFRFLWHHHDVCDRHSGSEIRVVDVLVVVVVLEPALVQL